MTRLAIDVGRSGIKVDCEYLDDTYAMAIIRNPKDDVKTKDKIFSVIKGRGPLKGDKTTYLMGQKNSSESFTQASEGESFLFDVKMLWEIYLTALAVRESGDTDVFLGVTFTFNNISVSKDYSSSMKGVWVVKIGNSTITFDIKGVIGAPQGYLSYISNNAGLDPGVVIDFGEYTLDLAFIQNGVLDNSNSLSLNIGSREVWNLVKQEIYKESYSDIPVSTLESGDDFSYNGIKFKSWNIKKKYNEALYSLYSNRFELSLKQALSGKPVSWVVVAGGVSSSLGKLINKTFPKLKIYVADNPRMANVKGLMKMMSGVSDEAITSRR